MVEYRKWKRLISLILAMVILLFAGIVMTICALANKISAGASAGYVDIPQITVLTPGLGGSAAHWSNSNGEGLAVFTQDTDSLLYKLSNKAGGAKIYRARTETVTYGYSYVLYDGYGKTITDIDSASKHIIIVFETNNAVSSNEVVYNEFEYMLEDVIGKVQDLNPNGQLPKVNLIGHSRGGITNLQFALDHPEYVESLISIGTPYFGSEVAETVGAIFLGESAGLSDINNLNKLNSYYNRWTSGYESKYKYINSIAIGATTTIDYLQSMLGQYNNEEAEALSGMLTWFSNIAIEQFTAAFAWAAYPFVATTFPAVGKLTQEQFVSLAWQLYEEIKMGVWYGDVMVPIGSQLGAENDKNYYFTKYVREFNEDNASTNPKLAVNNLPVIHNIETYDPDIHNYILKNIRVKSSDVIDNEISNVNRDYQINPSDGSLTITKWHIKVRNNHNKTLMYAYNAKMCFLEDARDWTGLTDINTFYLDPGESKIVEITPNFFATSIAVSYVDGNTRYVKYADNLSADYDVYKMTSYKNTCIYRKYSSNGMIVSIVGKNGTTWLIDIINNTGSTRSFYYNGKMCYTNDAQNWTGLTDIKKTSSVANGATVRIEISENASATDIAISYISGNKRKIFYAHNLDAKGTMTSNGSEKDYYSYTQNGMTVSISGKNGNTWLIELTNNTGSGRTFYYNAKLCYAGDAQNWNLPIEDERSVYLANGATTSQPLQISENMTATSIAICYKETEKIRKIFYAYDLDSSGTMTSFSDEYNEDNPPDECLVEGTLITLADGTQKAVEELTGTESLLVWNMETGEYDSAPIMFVDSEPIGHYEVIELTFSDGRTVGVVAEHGFWDVDLNEYVYLDENADDFIGHDFVVRDGAGRSVVTLTDVDISTEVTTVYSPVTYGYLCYFANGMLTMPGGIEGLFNIFEVDPDTLTIDEESYTSDIAEYGLYTYEEFAETFPISEEVFEAFNGQYLKVSMGKGLITEARIGELIARYAEFF